MVLRQRNFMATEKKNAERYLSESRQEHEVNRNTYYVWSRRKALF